MAWEINGTYYAPCSCYVGCPCTLGELDGDHGWCSGSLFFDIKSGTIDGVDVGGTKVIIAADWPRGFLAGEGTGRMYFDAAVSEEQQAALEAVLGGQKGGVFEQIAALIPNVLPSKKAPITVERSGDETRVTVADYGELVTTPLRGPTGEPTKLLHGAAAFREEIVLGRGTGTRWHDPEMRAWESSGHSELSDFDWSG